MFVFGLVSGSLVGLFVEGQRSPSAVLLVRVGVPVVLIVVFVAIHVAVPVVVIVASPVVRVAVLLVVVCWSGLRCVVAFVFVRCVPWTA